MNYPIKYTKTHRNFIKNHEYKNKKKNLNSGTIGLKTIQTGYVTEKQIEAVRREIIKIIRSIGKIQIKILPNKPLTKKPIGVRAGKGIGKLHYWVSNVKAGTILYELVGCTNKQKSIKALKKAQKKLPLKTKIIIKKRFF